jgi:hypothetical protein
LDDRLDEWRLPMKVEAIKVENGFLIPFDDKFEKTGQDKILLEVEILDQVNFAEGYALLDKMIGLYESNRSDAALNHDAIIYELRAKE